MATTDLYTVAGDIINTRPCIRFLGGAVDDQIQIDAAAVAMANSHLYGTLSAWFMVPDKTGTYGILSFGDENVVEFIQINVEAGTILVQCTDNTTAQWDYNTAANTVKPHTWHHVAGRYDGAQVSVWLDATKGSTVAAATSPIDGGAGDLQVGYHTGAYFFNGEISLNFEKR